LIADIPVGQQRKSPESGLCNFTLTARRKYHGFHDAGLMFAKILIASGILLPG
jgi:hypothetical protein